MKDDQWPVTLLTFAAIFVLAVIANCKGLQ